MKKICTEKGIKMYYGFPAGFIILIPIFYRVQTVYYEVNWDGSSYSCGVYFYKITTDDFIQTKRMLMLK